MATGQGTATINFGGGKGTNEASVEVTGQASISSISKADAFVMADDTSSNHTAADHRYFETFASLSCGTPTTATGFTIYARSHHKLTGTWTLRYVWAD